MGDRAVTLTYVPLVPCGRAVYAINGTLLGFCELEVGHSLAHTHLLSSFFWQREERRKERVG